MRDCAIEGKRTERMWKPCVKLENGKFSYQKHHDENSNAYCRVPSAGIERVFPLWKSKEEKNEKKKKLCNQGLIFLWVEKSIFN